MHIYPIDSYRWFLVIPMYWDEFSRPILERPRRWPSHHLARSKGWGARITWWKCSKKNERRPRQFWKFLGISKSFQYIFGFPVDYIVYLTSNDGINGSIDFSSNRSCWSFLTCFWCSFGAVRSRHRHCDWEIRRLECRWSPTLWPKTWQHTLRRFRHSKSPAFLSEMICHVWPLVWYVLINDDQW